MESKDISNKNKKIITGISETAYSVSGNFYNNQFTNFKQIENINSFLSIIFNNNPNKVSFVIDSTLFKDIHILINSLVNKNIQSEIKLILNDIFIQDKENTAREKWLDEYTIFFSYGKEYTHEEVINKLLNK